MKLERAGKDWALIGFFLFWSVYLLTWVAPIGRVWSDFLLFMLTVFAGFRWIAEDE